MQNVIKKIQKNKKLKFLLFFINDLFIIFFSSYLTLVLRYEKIIIQFDQYLLATLLAFLSYFPLIIFFKIYYQLQRYFNFNTVRFYVKIFLYYCLLLSLSVLLINFYIIIPRSFGILNTFIFFLLIILNRFLITLIIKDKNQNLEIKNILIFGVQKKVIKLISNLPFTYRVKSIVLKESFDNLKTINGIPTYNEFSFIDELNSKKINTVILSLNNIDEFDRKKYIKILYDKNISLLNFDRNNNLVNLSQEIDIGSLLFREEAINEINLDFEGYSILITGGAGSIGSELSRQILKLNPKKLLIVDTSEYNLFLLTKELNLIKNDYSLSTDIVTKLCDVSNISDLKYIIGNSIIDYVFHTAAYKHVPIVEDNIFAALNNNFFNTYKLAEFISKLNIKNFTLVSSDKAVRPTNIMGATKRLAELSVLYFNEKKLKTKFSIVRFGNVLESSGSVIPEFKQQILKGGPINVTHEKITRYFMSIEEAVILVLKSSQISKGGEIFLLDMGKPVKIIDLAKKMVRLYGKSIKNINNPFGDIEIKIIGLRPGEKLFEELLIEKNSIKTSHNLIFESVEKKPSRIYFEELLSNLIRHSKEKDIKKIKEILSDDIIGYKNEN